MADSSGITKRLEEGAYVVSGQPLHKHTCPDGHTFECSSPYCEDLSGLCPIHGGAPIVRKGLEPWRGRN